MLSLDVISGGVCQGACQQMMLELDLLMQWSRLFKWADITQPMEGLCRVVEGGVYPVFLPICLIDIYLLLICSCSSQTFKLRLASPLQHCWVSSSQTLAPTQHHWSYDPVVYYNLPHFPDFPLYLADFTSLENPDLTQTIQQFCFREYIHGIKSRVLRWSLACSCLLQCYSH